MITLFESEPYCTRKTNYQGLFQHNRGTGSTIIKEDLITSHTVGLARARAELLRYGYAERWVTIKMVHIPSLRQNHIIEFKGLNWIVKEIEINFTAPKLTMTVKGVRYE